MRTQTHYTTNQQFEIWGGRMLSFAGGMFMGTGIGTAIGIALSLEGAKITDQGKGVKFTSKAAIGIVAENLGFTALGALAKAGKYAYDLNRAVSNPMGAGFAKEIEARIEGKAEAGIAGKAEAGIAGKAEAGIAGKAEVGIAEKGKAGIVGKTGITKSNKFEIFDRMMGRGRARFRKNPVNSIDARDSIGHAHVVYPADLAKQLEISSAYLSREQQLDMEAQAYENDLIKQGNTQEFAREQSEVYYSNLGDRAEYKTSYGRIGSLLEKYAKAKDGGYVRVGVNSVTRFVDQDTRMAANLDASGKPIIAREYKIRSVGKLKEFMSEEYNELFADEIAKGTMFRV